MASTISNVEPLQLTLVDGRAPAFLPLQASQRSLQFGPIEAWGNDGA